MSLFGIGVMAIVFMLMLASYYLGHAHGLRNANKRLERAVAPLRRAVAEHQPDVNNQQV